MKTYYKANLYMITELYIDNNPELGIDPEKFFDNGLVQTITKKTLSELVNDLTSCYENIEHFEENRFETCYEYYERDGTCSCVSVSIYITKVVETDLHETDNNYKNIFIKNKAV